MVDMDQTQQPAIRPQKKAAMTAALFSFSLSEIRDDYISE